MSPDLPLARRLRAASDTECGRGLVILDLVADRWSGCAMGEGAFGPGGKTIWFELALNGGLSPDPGSASALAA